MNEPKTIRLAIQKSGRLHKRSIQLLKKCGIDFESSKSLLMRSLDFPLELLLVRDDDIPQYVAEGIAELGIVGLNELEEKIGSMDDHEDLEILRELKFGHCRLSLAIKKDTFYDGLKTFEGMRIASSYPEILKRYLKKNKINAEVVTINGSVELAPSIGVADAICDLVSTGATLESNGLREVVTIMKSQAVLVGHVGKLNEEQKAWLDKLLNRIDGVLKAEKARYIMMNAPESAVDAISKILPGMEKPTILPLHNQSKQFAIHAVAYEDVFWDTIEELKEAGASSILVVPIEKMIL